MSRLIINADDFGLTAGVNRAILELHRAGAVTSTTLMANAAATEEAIELARTTPSLGVGCHVVLVDGDPVLSPQEISPLIDARTGRFHASLQGFLARLLTRRIPAATIQAEAAAQIRLLQSKGVVLSHIDTHKHTHIFPQVLRPLLRAARAAGIHTVRNPFEPNWSQRATARASWLRRAEVRALQLFEARFRQIVSEEGFSTTDGAIGVLATGNLNQSTLQSLLQKLPEGTWELVAHPGYNDADLAQAHTRLLASRETEREALQNIRQSSQIEWINFANLRTN